MTDSTLLNSEDCWTAVLARDRAHDGRFVTGVLTTGIYCRPSCAARHPRRENVRFFARWCGGVRCGAAAVQALFA
jgi:AraC family transcriptional regulator of adaptative response/methylated-DNA-[protein]-cysteine methyltransferase